jgi:hypothetical protein
MLKDAKNARFPWAVRKPHRWNTMGEPLIAFLSLPLLALQSSKMCRDNSKLIHDDYARRCGFSRFSLIYFEWKSTMKLNRTIV